MEKDRTSQFRLIVILGLVAAVALVGIIIAVYLANNQSQVVNKMTGDLSVFEKADIDAIEKRLRSYLKTFYGMNEKEIAKVDMVIRDGSVKVKMYEGTKNVSFLVDLSDPKLTYEGILITGMSDDELFLNCPSIDLMQDKDVFCIGHELESTIDVALGSELPYETDIRSGDYFSIRQDYDNKHLPILKASVGVCDDDEGGKKKMKQLIRSWIGSKTEVDPEIFPLEMTYVDCSAFNDIYDFSDSPDPIRYTEE